MNDPIGYARHFHIMIVPITYGGDYQFDEARPATLVDLALAGVNLTTAPFIDTQGGYASTRDSVDPEGRPPKADRD